jgi:hypothetical protein
MKPLLTAVLAVIITATAFAQSQTPAAPAQNNFDDLHPRRAQVN